VIFLIIDIIKLNLILSKGNKAKIKNNPIDTKSIFKIKNANIFNLKNIFIELKSKLIAFRNKFSLCKSNY
jgi:hypothetical protein